MSLRVSELESECVRRIDFIITLFTPELSLACDASGTSVQREPVEYDADVEPLVPY